MQTYDIAIIDNDPVLIQSIDIIKIANYGDRQTILGLILNKATQEIELEYQKDEFGYYGFCYNGINIETLIKEGQNRSGR